MNVYNERGNQHIVGTCLCVISEGGRDGGKTGGRESRGGGEVKERGEEREGREGREGRGGRKRRKGEKEGEGEIEREGKEREGGRKGGRGERRREGEGGRDEGTKGGRGGGKGRGRDLSKKLQPSSSKHADSTMRIQRNTTSTIVPLHTESLQADTTSQSDWTPRQYNMTTKHSN